MIRLTTTEASFTTEPWVPTGETLLQLDTKLSAVAVEVQARLDAAAPWVTIERLNTKGKAMARIVALPSLRLSMIGNTPGETVHVHGS